MVYLHKLERPQMLPRSSVKSPNLFYPGITYLRPNENDKTEFVTSSFLVFIFIR